MKLEYLPIYLVEKQLSKEEMDELGEEGWILSGFSSFCYPDGYTVEDTFSYIFSREKIELTAEELKDILEKDEEDLKNKVIIK